MAFATWTPELSVGLEAVDLQHRELFEAVNRLHDAMQAGKGREELGRVLRFLRDYTDRHFGDEEALMASVSYPGSERHRELHGEFRRRVADLEALFQQGASMLSIEVLHLLRDWLVQHIQGEDRALGAWMRIQARH